MKFHENSLSILWCDFVVNFYVQVFGDMSIAGMDKDMKTALTEGTQNLENLMGSQYSLKVFFYCVKYPYLILTNACSLTTL